MLNKLIKNYNSTTSLENRPMINASTFSPINLNATCNEQLYNYQKKPRAKTRKILIFSPKVLFEFLNSPQLEKNLRLHAIFAPGRNFNPG